MLVILCKTTLKSNKITLKLLQNCSQTEWCLMPVVGVNCAFMLGGFADERSACQDMHVSISSSILRWGSLTGRDTSINLTSLNCTVSLHWEASIFTSLHKDYPALLNKSLNQRSLVCWLHSCKMTSTSNWTIKSQFKFFKMY